MSFSFRLDRPNVILEKNGLERGGRVQQYIDNEVLRLCEPYIPKQSGRLIQSGRAENGTVCYDLPYASYVYYGMASTGRPLTFSGAPKRGALWFERMKADHASEILEGARRIGGAK